MAMRIVQDEEERSRDDHPAGKRRNVMQMLIDLEPQVRRDSERISGAVQWQANFEDGASITLRYEPRRIALNG